MPKLKQPWPGAPYGASDNGQTVAAFQLHTPPIRNLYTFRLQTTLNLNELIKDANLPSHKALLEALNEDVRHMKKIVCSIAIAAMMSLHPPVYADSKAAVIDELAGYLEFVDYGGGVIFAEQIPKAEYSNMMVIDARDAGQFAKGHIPGAVNIEWRKVLEQRARIPKDKMVLIYCNTGSLSAQAGFALRVAGYDNVRILQGGFEEWKAKGGLDANARAMGAQPKH